MFSSKLKSVIKHHYNPNIIKRLLASKNPSNQSEVITKDPRITVTNDGQTIVCWHPPESFPYEHTLPYIENQQDYRLSSPLNIETIDRGENIYYKTSADRLGMEQLQAITYTNKDYWRRRRTDGLQLEPDHPRKGV